MWSKAETSRHVKKDCLCLFLFVFHLCVKHFDAICFFISTKNINVPSLKACLRCKRPLVHELTFDLPPFVPLNIILFNRLEGNSMHSDTSKCIDKLFSVLGKQVGLIPVQLLWSSQTYQYHILPAVTHRLLSLQYHLASYLFCQFKTRSLI